MTSITEYGDSATTRYTPWIPLSTAATTASGDIFSFLRWLDAQELVEATEVLKQRMLWKLPPKASRRAPVAMPRQYQRTFTGLRFKIGGSKK